MVALVAAGWRKPARAAVDPARARRDGLHQPVLVEEAAPVLARRQRWYRPILAAGGGVVMAIVFGMVIATVVGFGLAEAVITLTHLLKR
jgi:hypothetical protein